MAERERDEVTGVDTTGHEWDGIKELDNPLPRWWLWIFYLTIIWGIGYIIYYPAIPLLETNTRGLSQMTNRKALRAELEAVRAQRAKQLAALENKSLEEIIKDEKAFAFARRMGAAAFKVNCVQCHGAGAQGGFGYPNLNDDEWIWGGTLKAIHYTIANGIRYNPDTNEDTRQSEMPAFGEQLTPEQIDQVAEYILKLSGRKHDPKKAAAGEKIYKEEAGCNGCHGDNGQGMAETGGPALNNRIWLYAGDKEALKAQISKPKHGVMPAWKGRLDPATIKALTIYVYSLGGGARS